MKQIDKDAVKMVKLDDVINLHRKNSEGFKDSFCYRMFANDVDNLPTITPSESETLSVEMAEKLKFEISHLIPLGMLRGQIEIQWIKVKKIIDSLTVKEDEAKELTSSNGRGRST